MSYLTHLENYRTDRWALAVKKNSAKKCVNGCGRYRHYLSRFCPVCNARYYRWGSPNDRAIHKSWYDSERERYTRLISDELHRTKLVKMALSFCSTYLSKSLEGTQYRANPSGYVTQLAKAGLEAEEMLIEAISMYAFCTRRKRLPQYQVGNAVLRMKRWSPKAVRGIHRREVGGYLIQHLQPFFTALMEYESPQDRFRDALEKAAKEEL